MDSAPGHEQMMHGKQDKRKRLQCLPLEDRVDILWKRNKNITSQKELDACWKETFKRKISHCTRKTGKKFNVDAYNAYCAKKDKTSISAQK